MKMPFSMYIGGIQKSLTVPTSVWNVRNSISMHLSQKRLPR
ncbi:hypothetical protein EVA_13698 [gut metagenome]|uniref:Uncharacterized protein n=1 Tax=gut metagenome TaxID=749906 RepID=J9GFT1_9ZZZZ